MRNSTEYLIRFCVSVPLLSVVFYQTSLNGNSLVGITTAILAFAGIRAVAEEVYEIYKLIKERK